MVVKSVIIKCYQVIMYFLVFILLRMLDQFDPA